MRLLVLGGTRFVGRAVIEDALGRGWTVTALNRGQTGPEPGGVEVRRADRTDENALTSTLADDTWDLVVDTWFAAPVAATTAARLLAGRAGRYGYVSSGSVYEWSRHVDESSPVVDGDPQATDGSYPELKRGAELGVLAAFPDALLARAGLILGPYEDVGRLPWWLNRIARGGDVVAPGRPDRPLQYIDARDLAAWMLSALADGVTGPVDAIGRSGHATMASLLQACIAATAARARLHWIGEGQLAEAGAQPWTHLPCWVPESGEWTGFLEADTSLAQRTGLTARPVGETAADTWTWLRREGLPGQREDRDVHGLPPEIETRLLRDSGAASD